MLIEQAAYASRWRGVCPGAKAVFALAGLIAAFVAKTPLLALLLTLVLALVTVLGAGIALSLYLRVAWPASGFLALSSLTLLISLSGDGQGGLVWQVAPSAVPQIAELSARSLAALAAMLFLVLTTPLSDLIVLLRRLHVPEVLLDLMVLCYRMLFVFSEAVQDMLTAQQARLGFVTTRRGLHSLGLLAASLAAQVWLRARHLHLAALARNGEGSLRFLPREYPEARRELGFATAASLLLVLVIWAGGRA